MKNKKIKVIFILTIFLILIDQISKFIIKYNYEKPLGGDIISITLIQNTGIAFGLNSGNTKNIVLTMFILLIITNFVRTQKEMLDTKTAVAISLILAGGISNLLDRITQGGIIDFIKIENFAIFNFADCYIVLGWILLVVFLIKFNKNLVEVKSCEKK